MTLATAKPLGIVRPVFCLMTLAVSLLTVFPDQYTAFNIVIVLSLFLCFLLVNNWKVRVADVVVTVLTILLIVVQQDVTKISILVAYLFLQTKALYTQSLIKTYRNILLICFVGVLIAYMFGFNREYDGLRWSPTQLMFIEEKAMGFRNPNRCMLVAFCLSCITLVLTDNAWHYVLIAAANGVLFFFTQSRTFMYAILAIVVLLLLFKWARWETKYSFFGRMVPFVYLGFFALSILLPYFFADTYLNALLTGRLANNKVFLETGISWFGNLTLESGTFDSSYLHMLLTKGIIYTVIFSLVLFFSCRNAKITNKGAVILYAIFMASFMEVIFLESNILFLIGCVLHPKAEEETTDGQQDASLLLVRQQPQV